MWVSIRIERYIETIISLLRAIEAAIQGGGSALESAAKSERQVKTDKEGRIIAAVISPDDEYVRGGKTYKHKGYWAQIWLNVITGLAFVAAAVYAAIAAYQLGEIRKQTRASESAIVETRNAVDTSQSQFDRTMAQMLSQTVASQKAAEAAASAARTAHDALEVQTRPWIAIDGKPEIPNPPDRTALYPDRIKVRLRNFGSLPAVNVVPVFWIVDERVKPSLYFVQYDPCKESDRVARDKGMWTHRQRSTIFPGIDGEIPQTYSLDWPQGKSVGKYAILGCVAYSGSTPGKPYHTKVIYGTTWGSDQPTDSTHQQFVHAFSDLVLSWSDTN